MPWLPQPDDWKNLTAEAQAGDPGSMLELYRRALRLRRAEAALADTTLTWLPAPEDVLSYRRGGALTVVVNLSAHPVELPAHTRTAHRQRGTPRRPASPGHRRLAPGLKHAE